MEVSAEILAELEGLRELFRADAANHVAEAIENWNALALNLPRADHDVRPQAAALFSQVHRLAGTAATFGLHELAEAAAALEDHLSDFTEVPGASRPDITIGNAMAARLQAALTPR